MFSQLKLKIGDYLLRKKILKLERLSNIVTLSQVKTIAILFDAKTEQSILEIKILLKYFLNKNIDVHILGFVDNRTKDAGYISTIHMNYFNLNDVNIFGIPNSKQTIAFLDKKYDIVINLSLDNSFETKYLTLLSNSTYRIGGFIEDYNLSYDLMFKLKIKSLGYFIENLIHYLELINNNEK